MRKLFAALIAVALPSFASAATFTDRASLLAAATGFGKAETFAGATTGDKGPSFTFSNGTLAAAPGGVRVISGVFCNDGGDNCLVGGSLTSTRTFSGFAANTTAFGLDLKALGSADRFTVTAVTGNGTQTFETDGTGTFLGFSDAGGITSISLTNLGDGRGHSNYSLDNILTFSAAASGFTFDRDTFATSSSDPLATETFETFSPGNKGASFAFSNATLEASGAAQVTSGSFCATGNCVIGSSLTSTRTFSGFAADTTGFALDLKALGSADRFTITAVTGNGTQTFDTNGRSDFVGFRDDSGIMSISLTNLGDGRGHSNYSFDNILTFSRRGAAVPEPATWMLMLAGFGGVGAALRRRKAAGAAGLG